MNRNTKNNTKSGIRQATWETAPRQIQELGTVSLPTALIAIHINLGEIILIFLASSVLGGEIVANEANEAHAALHSAELIVK